MSKMVRLTATLPAMVGNERDIDKQAPSRSLAVPAVVWRKALALAELRSFRPPRRDFLPGQTVQFAAALREAMNAAPPAPRRPSHQTPLSQLADFFRVPAHRKALLAILTLVSAGGTLDITEE